MFEKFFGVEPAVISRSCIILPSGDRGLFGPSGRNSSGMLAAVSESECGTLISLKSRWVAGDAVLLLKDTPCENVALFGSCGSLEGPPPGKVLVSGAFNLESFTGFLRDPAPGCIEYVEPPGELTGDFGRYCRDKDGDIIEGKCATVSSLMLEYEKLPALSALGAGYVDMEASMVFSAAEYACKSALGLFYVSDSPGRVDFYSPYGRDTAEKIKGSKKSLALRLRDFLKSERG